MTLNAQMNMYLCYHYVPLLLLLLCYPNFGRKFKFEMQNANAKGKCNRLSVKPFIATALLYKCLSFTTVGAPTDGVGVPSPQHRQEGTMTTYPARGVVFITLSSLGWGEGTPTPSVGSCFLALSVELININSCS